MLFIQGLRRSIKMPIYEYNCEGCGKNFEYLVLGEEATHCPKCNSEKVKRQMSVCGFVSKGAGGETISSSASDTSCGGCTATSCSSCGH